MKVRNSFVSNSSTSSFVLLGVETKLSVEALEELECKHKKLYALRGEEDGLEDGQRVVGLELGHWDENDPGQSYSFSDLQASAKQLADLLEVDLGAIRLWCGTRMS